MPEVTNETVRCIEEAFERKDPGGGFPLTSWEKVQLARAWTQRNQMREALQQAAWGLKNLLLDDSPCAIAERQRLIQQAEAALGVALDGGTKA